MMSRPDLAKRNTTHGLSRTHPREYRTWKEMRARCLSPINASFKDYGGRGIAICERWNDFGIFFADMGIRPDGMTLDRIDVNGDYGPLNCRWATDVQQANNRRSNRAIVIDGETKTLQEWCVQYGVDHSKVRYRLSRGYPLKQAFSAADFRL